MGAQGVKNLVKNLYSGAPSVRLGGREFPLAPRWEEAYVAIIPWLNEKSISERDALVAELLAGADLPAEALAPYRTLTWEQMRAAPPQVTFGAHTRSHPFLSRLPHAEAEDEIAGSKAMLEKRLGVTVRHFAYPFGGPDCFTKETVELVRAAGFASAVTTTRGACQPGADPYRLPRILFDGSVGGNVVAVRLSGLWLFLTT